MASRICVFCFLVLWALPLGGGDVVVPSRLIVWNTGQGQWITVVDADGCWHFDTGGERVASAAIMRACRERKNYVTFSHWDWDHISFASRLPGWLPEVCVLFPPVGRASARKERMMRRLRSCGEDNNRNPVSGEDKSAGKRVPFLSWVNENGRTANDKSRVVWWRDILIPGDSTKTEERYWVHAFPRELRRTRILVLGHHGSQTSTSKALLDRVPYVVAAVASARARRYGHPHPRVVSELRRRGIPVLSTEDWGTLIFDL